MLTECLPVKIPIERLSIFMAKPVRSLLKDSNAIGMRHLYIDRAFRLGLKVEEYGDLIIKYITGNEKDIIPQSLREDIKFEVAECNYTPEDIEDFVEIVTPFGNVRVHPHEYNIVGLDFALNMADGGAHVLRYLDNKGDTTDKMKKVGVREKLFYLQSRGISFTNAMKHLTGEIKTQHLFYFDPYPQYVEVYTRNYMKHVEKKLAYCTEHGYPELLEYPATKEDEAFHLSEYKDHLEKLLV